MSRVAVFVPAVARAPCVSYVQTVGCLVNVSDVVQGVGNCSVLPVVLFRSRVLGIQQVLAWLLSHDRVVCAP